MMHSRQASGRPSRRENFEIAIICALPVEYQAASLIIEEFWDEIGDLYGKAAGDKNIYRTGRIGNHNIVLLLLSGMGKVNAAHAAANLYSSFTGLRLVLLVGGCAAVPRINDADILLGDVIISTGVTQYDFGRKYPNGFVRKDSWTDNLGKPDKEIGNMLMALQAPGMKSKLSRRTANLLTSLQKSAAFDGYGIKYQYPGVREDKLYEAGYLHKHHNSNCTTCNEGNNAVCEEALQMPCEDLGCETNHLINRKRLENRLQLCKSGDISHQTPEIHFGVIGSGDMVMKSGEDRDALAKKEKVIAFEMEAAGIWEKVPCLVIKGVFDYGDSHKNKRWQAFASATAACVARAIVERFSCTDRVDVKVSSHAIEDNRSILGARQTNVINNATQNTSGFIKGNIAVGQSEQANSILFASIWPLWLISSFWRYYGAFRSASGDGTVDLNPTG